MADLNWLKTMVACSRRRRRRRLIPWAQGRSRGAARRMRLRKGRGSDGGWEARRGERARIRAGFARPGGRTLSYLRPVATSSAICHAPRPPRRRSRQNVSANASTGPLDKTPGERGGGRGDFAFVAVPVQRPHLGGEGKGRRVLVAVRDEALDVVLHRASALSACMPCRRRTGAHGHIALVACLSRELFWTDARSLRGGNIDLVGSLQEALALVACRRRRESAT